MRIMPALATVAAAGVLAVAAYRTVRRLSRRKNEAGRDRAADGEPESCRSCGNPDAPILQPILLWRREGWVDFVGEELTCRACDLMLDRAYI